MKVINPSLRIGDIVRIIQPNFARLNTHWYDRREQQLIAYAVGRRAQVRSIYEYNGNVRYKLLIEGISRTTTYGFELHDNPKYYKHTELVSLTAPSLNYTLF